MITNHLENITSANFVEGEAILLNKPVNWTSFDVVARTRGILGVKKIGHAGTLDPKADGLLILCTGKKTKEIDTFSAQKKEYTGVLELGAITKSFDTETEVVETKDISGIDVNKIRETLNLFHGKQLQMPPMYSAVKVNGKRLYKHARKGREIFRPAREIEIFEIEMLSCNLPNVEFRVVCSKGTYIRTLVNDIGIKLGCGAYLKSLTRTAIGDYKVEDALTIEQLHLLEKYSHQTVNS